MAKLSQIRSPVANMMHCQPTHGLRVTRQPLSATLAVYQQPTFVLVAFISQAAGLVEVKKELY